MKKYFYFAFLLFGCLFSLLTGNANAHCLKVLDTFDANELPKNYRSTNQWCCLRNKGISTIGLSSLHESGSAQFSEKQLRKILQIIPDFSVIDVDLRQESHGFLNGSSVSLRGINNWCNVGKTYQQIKQSESNFLNNLEKSNVLKIAVFEKNPNQTKAPYFKFIRVKSVSSEEQMTQRYGIGYKRFYITDRCRPTDGEVNAFIDFIKLLPKQTWVHFHCLAGKGRTTTFMVMYDMLHNANDVSFDDILNRQASLGGADLKKPLSPSNRFFSCASDRLTFLHQFYTYCQIRSNDQFKTQ